MGSQKVKRNFFYLSHWYNALSVLTVTTTYIFLTAKNSCFQSGHGQLTMFNIHKWTLPLEIVLAWSDEKWVFSKNIRKVWQTEHVNKPGNMLSIHRIHFLIKTALNTSIHVVWDNNLTCTLNWLENYRWIISFVGLKCFQSTKFSKPKFKTLLASYSWPVMMPLNENAVCASDC